MMQNDISGRVRDIQALREQVETELGRISGNYVGLDFPSCLGGERFSHCESGITVSETEWFVNDEKGSLLKGETYRYLLIFAGQGIAILAEGERECGNVYRFQTWLNREAVDKYGIGSPLFDLAAIRAALTKALEDEAVSLEDEAAKVRELMAALAA